MKKLTVLLTITLGIGSASLQAHSHHHHVIVQEVYPTQVIVANDPAPLIVNEAPPALLVEEISPSPGPNYVYIGGNWEWHGRWVWKKHEWVLKPQFYTTWEPGHWHRSDHHHGYVFESGHWR